MTRLGEGHGLRLFPFPRAFPVIASLATPEPRRRRPQANVTPIPNRCQLEPIASPCRFEHFQALARSTRGDRASRPIGRGRRRRPRVSSRRPFNSEWRIVRSASPFPRCSPSASYQHAQPRERGHPPIHERVHRVADVLQIYRVETVSRICGVGGRGAAKSAGGRRRNRGWLRFIRNAMTGRAQWVSTSC